MRVPLDCSFSNQQSFGIEQYIKLQRLLHFTKKISRCRERYPGITVNKNCLT